MPTVSRQMIVRIALIGLALPIHAHALTPSEVFERVKESVFVVKTFDGQGKPKGLGSAVLLPNGKIGTNCHVVEGGARFQVGRGDRFSTATLYAGDRDKDICLLDADAIGGKPAQLGKAGSLKVGMEVYAVGAPRGLELSLSDGIVAQLRGGPPPFIQTTAAISPGSSGGGLFDSEARLVGFTTLYIDGGQNLNFAIPVEWLAEVKPDTRVSGSGRSQAEWLKRAMALETRENFKGMVDWCQQWVKAEPKNAEAWRVLGGAYHRLYPHYRNEAIDAYRQSLRIDPENAGTWLNLGSAYLIRRQYAEAADAYRQGLRIKPDDASLWYMLGRAYYIHRPADAVGAYRQAVRINPNDIDALEGLGSSFRLLKRHVEAIEVFRKVLHLDANRADTWAELGLSYDETGNRTAALEAVRALRRLDPDRAEKLLGIITSP